MATAQTKRKSVDAIRHQEKRANIPTEELRDFVAADEDAPATMLYPRDPSLDPQLVWHGKDEQDQSDLEVPVVPIYIQEKIQPQAIIENVMARADEDEPQPSLFDDFDGIEDFDRKVDFYHHAENWSNRLILGDSLLVMTSLAEKEGLKGKVQTIYIDPPYGIKFGSNWQVSTRKRQVADGRAEDATRQPEQVRAFRDTWRLGIHSYLAYLRDRLIIARDLLTETGSVFVQISDENVHRVRNLLDEVFGDGNFVALITFRKKTMPLGAKYLESISDYILWYAKDTDHTKFRRIFQSKPVEGDSHWNYVELPDGNRRRMTDIEIQSHRVLPKGSQVYQLISLYPAGLNSSGLFPVSVRGTDYLPPPGKSWSTNSEGMKRLLAANRIEPYEGGDTIRYVLKLQDYDVTPITSTWADSSAPTDMVFVVQTNTEVVKRCLLMTTDPGDLVFDPTCGSGTTAYVAEQWGRRWISVDTSRVALALARTRIMSARFPYYLLQDSSEGHAKESELTGMTPPWYETTGDIRKGFVYKRVPHITLKSIANNPEIREGMTREEIDAAIARYADSETLCDQPYEDNKRVRVAGPFTVESLSPHRILPTDDEKPATIIVAQQSAADFATTVVENLRRAPVQTSVKEERLRLDRLDPFAGTWIQAAGEYADNDGSVKRVAVSVGPQFGTVTSEQVKEAAKEALQGVGFDLLLVCGFAFDAHTGETANEFKPLDLPHDGPMVAERRRQYGKLPVLLVHMNPDLFMGDELLKKTGAGNLFMVFGEPDVDIIEVDGQVVVEIKGVDVYDPTTGSVRSSSTDDIACWFIDTDYNGESFFVRHAYFTGAEEPYEKLKRALRAEVDEDAWSTLYSTVSRPFDVPKTGKIAVKVINHYGDEVLKVYSVDGMS